MTRAQRIDAACLKIRYQMPDTEEADIAHLVIRQAVKDLFSARAAIRGAAVKYLSGKIDAAEDFGVESDWVRRVLKESGLFVAA